MGDNWDKPYIQIPAFLAFPSSAGKDLETIPMGNDLPTVDRRLEPTEIPAPSPKNNTQSFTLGLGGWRGWGGEKGNPGAFQGKKPTPMFQPKEK